MGPADLQSIGSARQSGMWQGLHGRRAQATMLFFLSPSSQYVRIFPFPCKEAQWGQAQCRGTAQLGPCPRWAAVSRLHLLAPVPAPLTSPLAGQAVAGLSPL